MAVMWTKKTWQVWLSSIATGCQKWLGLSSLPFPKLRLEGFDWPIAPHKFRVVHVVAKYGWRDSIGRLLLTGSGQVWLEGLDWPIAPHRFTGSYPPVGICRCVKKSYNLC